MGSQWIVIIGECFTNKGNMILRRMISPYNQARWVFNTARLTFERDSEML